MDRPAKRSVPSMLALLAHLMIGSMITSSATVSNTLMPSMMGGRSPNVTDVQTGWRAAAEEGLRWGVRGRLRGGE